MGNIPNKAVSGSAASLTGGGLGGAITTLIISAWWHDASPEGAAALATVITAVLGAGSAFLGAYLPKMEGGG